MGSKAFSIYQGDALQITCSVTNNNGEVLNLTNYDGIHFTVKTNKESPTLIIHKTLGAGITVVSAAKGQLKVTLLNDDSKEIEPGLYYYEIMLEDTSEDLQYVVVQDFVKVIGRVLGYPESVPGNFIVMGNFQVGVDDGLARTAKFFADVTVGSPTNPRTFTKYGSANIIGAVADDYALRLQHNSSEKPVLLIRNAADITVNGEYYAERLELPNTYNGGTSYGIRMFHTAAAVINGGAIFTYLDVDASNVTNNGTMLGAKFTGCSIVVTGNGQYIQAPVMTSGSKPGTPGKGMIIFNDTSGKGEMYDGSTWQSMW